MMLKLTRGLWVWAGLLALALVLVILPLSPGNRAICALFIIALVAFAWSVTGRRAARSSAALHLLEGDGLPPSEYRQPVVLVCGEALDSMFGAESSQPLALRLTDQGCYLRVPAFARLPGLLDALLVQRPHWARQLSVLYVVNPADQDDQAEFAGQVRGFRHQLAIARKRGAPLPLIVVSYQRGRMEEGVWFTREAGKDDLAAREANVCLELAHWASRPETLAGRAARMQASIQAGNAARWLEQQVLTHLIDREQRDSTCPPVAYAVALVPALPCVANSLWAQWRQGQTGLIGSEPSGLAHQLRFPDPLLHVLPRQSGYTPARRTGLRALWLFVLASGIGMASSAWQNHLLLRQVSDDLRRYQAIPQPAHRKQPEFALKEAAVTVLKNDAERLDGYYRQGAPMFLGLGLYTGEQLRVPLQAAIAAHREPPEPPTPKIPDPVRLDSLSLFASGSADLKPGSTKVLISALVDIKAQPGWLIVIAGHTDVTGDPRRNLLLSRARAAAVRDWMQRMGDIPDSCFAVQGFGADQPIASNDTPEGRAANRRVDIRLVPEEGACVLPARVSSGQPQSRQSPAAQLTL